jgi:hypothetical protein
MTLNMFVYKSCRHISIALEGFYESCEPSKSPKTCLKSWLESMRLCGHALRLLHARVK